MVECGVCGVCVGCVSMGMVCVCVCCGGLVQVYGRVSGCTNMHGNEMNY